MDTNKLSIISFRRAAGLAGLWVAGYFIVLMLVRGEQGRLVFSDVYFPAQSLFAAGAMLYAWRYTAARQPKLARSWFFWMLALLSNAIGETIWSFLELGLKTTAFPSLADPFYLLFYGFMGLGLYVFPLEKMPAGERKFALLDNLIIVLGSGLCLWTVLVGPMLIPEEPNLLAQIIGIAYPVLDMVLLWGVLVFFRNRAQKNIHLPVLFLGIGMLGTIASDVIFALPSINQEYVSGTWIDIGWVAGAAFFALAAIQQIHCLAEKGEEPGMKRLLAWLRSLRSWPVYLPYIWVIMAYGILTASLPIESDKLPLVTGIGIMIALVIFRQVLTLRENERLYWKAQDELSEQRLAQEALQQTNLALDLRVQERTRDLQNTNQRLIETNNSLESEIVEREQVEKLLLHRADSEKLIASIAATFINLSWDEIDREIDRSLQMIGEFVGADRSYILQLFNNNTQVSNTYEWCHSGVQAQKANMQEIPVANIPWLMTKLNRNEVIHISSVTELPDEAQAEKTILLAQNIQSLVVVPLVWNRLLVGFMGFDSVGAEKNWKDEDITRLKITGEILVTALQRKSGEEALTRYIRRLKILHEIDRSVLAGDSTERITSNAMQSLFNLIPGQAGALALLNSKEQSVNLFLLKNKNGLQPVSFQKIEDPQSNIDITQAVETLNQKSYLRGKQIPSIIYKKMYTAELHESGYSTMIAVPVRQQKLTIGFLCMRQNSTTNLTQDEIDTIGEVAYSLAIAFQQAKMQQELTQRMNLMEISLREKEVLLKEVHHRVKNNLQVVSSLLNLQTRVVQDPTAQSALRDAQTRVRSMALIHEKLYQSDNLSQIMLGSYIKSLSAHLFHSYQQDNGRIKLVTQVDEITAGIDMAVPVGLILNELISNSLKHAFPDARSGEIGVEFQQEIEDSLLLRYYDNGIGFPNGLDVHSSKSLGMQLVFSLTRQLNGEIKLQNQTRTEFSIRIPLIPNLEPQNNMNPGG